MNKTERIELAKLVKQQFRVLKAEVAQRKAEMLVDIERQIAERYHDEDVAWAEAARIGSGIVEEANRKVNDTFHELVGPAFVRHTIVRAWMPDKPTEHRSALRREAQRRVEADTKAALVRVERQEADLLRNLAIDLIESDEAKAFLAGIPDAAQLVEPPAMAEIEAEVERHADAA